MRKKLAFLLALMLFLLTGCSGGGIPPGGGRADFDQIIYADPRDRGDVEMTEIFQCTARPLGKSLRDEEVIKLYLEALADGKQNGYTPMVVFVDDRLQEAIEDAFEAAGGRDGYIQSILANDHSHGKAFLEETHSKMLEFIDEALLTVDPADIPAWPASAPDRDANSFLPAPTMFDGDAYLVQVPTANPYEVFAWLPFCGWNGCPVVDDMIAVCKYWYERYGAIPTTITADTLAFYLENPITSPEMVAAAVNEQVAFCPDSMQFEGPGAFVSMTNHSHAWMFWWD